MHLISVFCFTYSVMKISYYQDVSTFVLKKLLEPGVQTVVASNKIKIKP